MDKLYKLAQIPNKGRGLIALQNLPKGQLLFAERPIVACMREEKLGKYCSYCYNPLSPSESDQQALDTFHEDCDEIGWKTLNYKYCGVRNRDYKVVDDKKFPIMSRLILSDTLQKTLSSQSTLWNGILRHLCFANNSEWITDKTPYIEWIDWLIHKKQNIAMTKDDISKIVPFEMYDRICRILHLNCITIQDGYNDDIATGLFGFGSMFNHSCQPNVEIVPKMENRSGYGIFNTITDIKEGDELCIQYAGQNDNYQDRQRYLMWVYGFQCQCIKCLADKAHFNAQQKTAN